MHTVTEGNCVFDAVIIVMKRRRRRRRRRRKSGCLSSRRGKPKTLREETISTDLGKRLITWTSPSASVLASSILFSPAIFSAKIVILMPFLYSHAPHFFPSITIKHHLPLLFFVLCCSGHCLWLSSKSDEVLSIPSGRLLHRSSLHGTLLSYQIIFIPISFSLSTFIFQLLFASLFFFFFFTGQSW